MRVRVTKHFGDRVLFDGFDFYVEEGSIVRLTGPSGRGKTTLLRIISGLEENEDKSPSDFSGHSFAWVFQEDRLASSAGAYSNIALALGRSVDRRTILAAFAELGLGEPFKKVCQYSGGMKRRLALMRALLSDGQILILDEPFTGLDPDSRALAEAFIAAHRRERTCIIVSHEEEGPLLRADRTVSI